MRIRIKLSHLSPTPPIQDGQVFEPGWKISIGGKTYILENGGEAKVTTKTHGRVAFVSVIEITEFTF